MWYLIDLGVRRTGEGGERDRKEEAGELGGMSWRQGSGGGASGVHRIGFLAGRVRVTAPPALLDPIASPRCDSLLRTSGQTEEQAQHGKRRGLAAEASSRAHYSRG